MHRFRSASQHHILESMPVLGDAEIRGPFCVCGLLRLPHFLG